MIPDRLKDEADPAPPSIMTADRLGEFPSPVPHAVIDYGEDPLQFGELWLPESAGQFPVVVFLHGGCWKSEYDIAHSRKLTAAIAAAGIAVWSLEYRRVGDPGGGWPGTFDDVESGYAQLAALCDRFTLDASRVIIAGHSAGGHLALWLAQRIAENSLQGIPAPCGILGLAPAPDLEFLFDQGACDDAVAGLMGGSPAEYPERYAYGSVSNRIPVNTRQILVIGRYDEAWRPVGVRYARSALAAGAPVEIVDATESGHFEMIDPDSSTWPSIVGALRRLVDSP